MSYSNFGHRPVHSSDFFCSLNEGCVTGLCYLQYRKSITCFPQVHIVSLHTVVPFVVVTFQLLYYTHALNSGFLYAILRDRKRNELVWSEPSPQRNILQFVKSQKLPERGICVSFWMHRKYGLLYVPSSGEWTDVKSLKCPSMLNKKRVLFKPKPLQQVDI